MKEKKVLLKRKWWFRFVKAMTKVRYKEPEFVYLGEKFDRGGIILSNHEGTDAPLSLELYSGAPLRMWGAHEMNSGLIKLYKYQSEVYYHEKKHWNIHLARLFCLIASPLTNMFYKGLGVISTYRDARFIKTVRESYQALDDGYNVVIYPEDSTKGYLEVLEGFYSGFATFAEYCLKKGKDVPIYVTYFRKKDLKYIVAEPVFYSQLKAYGATKEQISRELLERCNELGQLNLEGNEIKKVA